MQIIVYTGAILMLFLFVLMLVGVDASDSVVETIRGQRVLAVLGRARLGLVLVLGVGQIRSARRRARRGQRRTATSRPSPTSCSPSYVFAFETTSALLITAAVGAMVLAHRERLTPKPTQQDDRAQGGRGLLQAVAGVVDQIMVVPSPATRAAYLAQEQARREALDRRAQLEATARAEGRPADLSGVPGSRRPD